MAKKLSRSSWNQLSSYQKYQRNLSLEVLRRMRGGHSLTYASKQLGISRSTVLSNLGITLFKRSRRWQAKKSDSIDRAINIYEQGKVRTIIVKGSKHSRTIGEYYNAVRNYIISGDSTYLKPFKKKRIVDSKGKKYRLETNPKNIYDIEESKEDSEFFEIYADE